MALLAFVLFLLYIVFFSLSCSGPGVHHRFAFLFSTGYVMNVFFVLFFSVVSAMGFGSWGLTWRDCYDATESMVLVRVNSGSGSGG